MPRRIKHQHEEGEAGGKEEKGKKRHLSHEALSLADSSS